MDKSAWKTDDPEWVKHREEQWELLQKYKKYWLYAGLDTNSELVLKQVNDFYFGIDLEYPNDIKELGSSPFWTTKVALHPNPSVDTIREIYNDYLIKMEKREVSGRYPVSYKIISEWGPLIKDGLLPESIVDAFMEALYGNSFEEAIEINQINLAESLIGATREVFSYVMGYAMYDSDADCDYIPYQRLWKQVEGMLLRLDDIAFDNLEFEIKRTFRNVNQFESMDAAKIPHRKAVIEMFKTRMRELRDQLNPRFWPYIDALAD